MTKNQLEKTLQSLSTSIETLDNVELKNVSLILHGLLKEKITTLDKDDDYGANRLNRLIEHINISLSGSTRDKMDALIAITDETNWLILKANLLKATAAFVKTLAAFVSVAWFGAWMSLLGAYYVTTFPVGIIIECALSAVKGYPPIAAVCVLIGAAPFTCLGATLFDSVEKDKQIANTAERFKTRVQNDIISKADVPADLKEALRHMVDSTNTHMQPK